MNRLHENPRHRWCSSAPSATVLPGILAAALLASGCGSGSGDRSFEIKQTRVVPYDGQQLNAKAWQRFGYQRQDLADDRRGQVPSKPRYTFELPAGWQQQPARALRDVNLKVGEVECYVSTLTGGGVAANVNRWRQQMGLPGYSTEELESLPRRKALGREGVRVECVGSFTGMSGAARPGYKLHALYVQFPAFAVSVKMVGPAVAADAAREGFEKFVDSLQIDISALGKGATAGGHGRGQPKDGFDRSKLRWDIPAGWQRASGSSMRIVTFKVAGKVAGHPGAECWVIDLSGTAGGIIDNINRWRSEMQKPPLSAQDVDRLPRIEILGEQSPLLEEDGSYHGMGGPKLEKGVLFGVVCPLSDVTLFIKMVGGAEDMQAAKNDFLKFCASLRVES